MAFATSFKKSNNENGETTTTTTTSYFVEDEYLLHRRRCGQVFGKGLELKPCLNKDKNETARPTFITNLPTTLTPTNNRKCTKSIDDDENDSFTAVTAALSFDEEDDLSTATTDVASSIHTTTAPTKKSVRFDTVEVRHYGRTVDGHPCTQAGPALTLTWKVELREKLEIGTFERIRQEQRSACSEPVRRLGPAARQRLLMQDWHVPSYEIRNAMYTSQLIQKQRRDTLQALKDEWYYEQSCTSSTTDDEEDWYTYSDSDDDEDDDEELLWDVAQDHFTTSSDERYAVDAEEEDEPHLLAYDY